MPGVKRQSSCAECATRAAYSASSARARGTSSMLSSVAGFSTGNVSPERLATNSPLMNIFRIYDFLCVLGGENSHLRCGFLLKRLCKSFQRHIDQISRNNQRRLDPNDLRFVQRVSNQHVAIEHALRQ